MINSHKEFVGELQRFADKMDFITNFIYNTDAQGLEKQVENLDSRGLIVSFLSADMREDYNFDLTYGFTFIADSLNTVEEVINAEEENLFCLSALDDYLNHILDVPVTIANIDSASDGTSSEIRQALTGTITFTIKRTASYWKKMEQFNV